MHDHFILKPRSVCANGSFILSGETGVIGEEDEKGGNDIAVSLGNEARGMIRIIEHEFGRVYGNDGRSRVAPARNSLIEPSETLISNLVDLTPVIRR